MAIENNIEDFLFDIHWLKQNQVRMYYFGLGFIQLKVSDRQRIHFYTNEFQRTSEDEIHNHRYDFSSKIVRGKLKQEIYSVSENDNGNFSCRKESCRKDNKPEYHPTRCNAVLATSQTFNKGSEYWINHDTFHKVFSDDAITILTTGEYKKELADVVSPLEKTEFICPFSIEVSQDKLFEVIAKMIRND